MGASRIANVTAAWLGGFGAGRSSARAGIAATTALFDETLWVGADEVVALGVLEDVPQDVDRGEADRADRGALRRVAIASDRRDFVSGLAAAIVAARSERVVVMPAGARGAGAELALALVAWPERAVVAVAGDEAAASFCGIHRRADLLERAQAALEGTRPVPSLAAFLDGVDVERLSLARLGLDDEPHPLFTALEAR